MPPKGPKTRAGQAAVDHQRDRRGNDDYSSDEDRNSVVGLNMRASDDAGPAPTHENAHEPHDQEGVSRDDGGGSRAGSSGAGAPAFDTERLLSTMMEAFARTQAETNRTLMETLRSLHHGGPQSPNPASPTTNGLTTGNFAKCTARFDGQSRDPEVLEAFLDAVEVYKECADVTDEHALRGLPMLLCGEAAVWWRGARASIATWPGALARLRATYGVQKPAYRVLREVFASEQSECERAEARSKLPKKRRRVLPVEQPRRKRDVTASNRRVNAVKHPVALKDLSPGGNKFGVNGMNMISLALQGPPNILTRPGTAPMQPLQARAPIVESPIVNTQAGAISLASLQPPLMTAPPLQPRPATTGALDLMLPLQPKLLPGYNLQSSFLTSTMSTVRPPDLPDKVELKETSPDSSSRDIDECKNLDSTQDSVSKVECENHNLDNDNDVSDVTDNSYSKDEINSNVIDAKTIETSLVSSSNDNSPNNNSY